MAQTNFLEANIVEILRHVETPEQLNLLVKQIFKQSPATPEEEETFKEALTLAEHLTSRWDLQIHEAKASIAKGKARCKQIYHHH